MGRLYEVLESGGFGITAELAPPKGVDFSAQMETAGLLKDRVHAVNVTDLQGACLKASSLGLCIHLKAAGSDPVLQITGRDRSRMAIMAEVLSGASFGIDTVLALTGDHPTLGDCRASKPVFDLDSVGILHMLSLMEATGNDCGGNALEGPVPRLFKGAVVTPVYEPFFLQLNKLRRKAEAGACYIQTQAIFETESPKRLLHAMDRAGIRAYVLAGIIPLKSAGMARYMNEHVPGICVPEEIIARLEAAALEGKEKGIRGLPAKLGLELAAELAAEIKRDGLCSGIHLMAVGAERSVPDILDLAGIGTIG